jgi:hypothetical protein
MSIPIGRNQLHLNVNKLTSNFLDLCKKTLPNKIGQGVGITCMEEALVPQKVWYGGNRSQGLYSIRQVNL